MGTENENSPPAGGSTPPAASESSAQPPGDATPAPPPAAEVVANAKINEREVQLAQEVEVHKVTLKQREQRINQLEDENHKLKSVTKPKGKSGWTFFE